MYHAFRLRPFGGPRARTLVKMPKCYVWDPSLVEDRAARFENLIAGHVLKFCHFLEDTEGHRMGLHYLRDREGREVDLLVTAAGKPWFAVEVKLSETRVDPSLRHFKAQLGIPFAYQVTLDETRDVVDSGVRVVGASRFLGALV